MLILKAHLEVALTIAKFSSLTFLPLARLISHHSKRSSILTLSTILDLDSLLSKRVGKEPVNAPRTRYPNHLLIRRELESDSLQEKSLRRWPENLSSQMAMVADRGSLRKNPNTRRILMRNLSQRTTTLMRPCKIHLGLKRQP